jgi:hypothetical protein
MSRTGVLSDGNSPTALAVYKLCVYSRLLYLLYKYLHASCHGHLPVARRILTFLPWVDSSSYPSSDLALSSILLHFFQFSLSQLRFILYSLQLSLSGINFFALSNFMRAPLSSLHFHQVFLIGSLWIQ